MKVHTEKVARGQTYGTPSLTATQKKYWMEAINGDVAIDFYHRYKEDVGLMKQMGLDAYRFSISWSRILPSGNLSGGINKEGVKYYNNLINELISNGIQPFVTIYHWDLPQALEDQYGGFLSPHIIEDYRDYAEVCFKAFGDRVKHWITFNEPLVSSYMGYATGMYAPGRCTPKFSGNCSAGNSGTEPYTVSHHVLLAHAVVVKLYRDKYQATQKGKIGITIISAWYIPLSDSKSDSDATQRVLDFNYGWFMDPLTQGDYPFIMRMLAGDRLPKFTEEESKLLKGSYDFIGINYYTSTYAFGVPFTNPPNHNYLTDSYTSTTGVRNGVPLGRVAATDWLMMYPKGLKDLLAYTKEKYNNPVIYITENGVDEKNDPKVPLKEALNDKMRIDYYKGHLQYLHKAMREGVDVRGYFMWSFMDDFEWNSGYTVRFGLHYVDYKNGLKRYPKNSALWFKKFLKRS
ncbi:beta-glucosidase 12 [Canna indica]|uniref:Beta-glucosidase 12 n=1 Tax=Canna indica TaxID=4628 RepID=A0AAQ3QQ04_9LILI|nr:beta-glucosidase 12 [Canna indica]